MSDLLHAPGKRGDPACSGTRNIQDNLSDLRAQARKTIFHGFLRNVNVAKEAGRRCNMGHVS